MASVATDLLVGKLVAILENEASSIAGIRDEVDDIKAELASMKSFLKDVDEGKKVLTEGEKEWVTSVRELTYEVEDIIDEFIYHMSEQPNGGRFSRKLKKAIWIPKNLWYKRQIANKLHKVTKMIKAIPERNQRYHVGAEQQGASTYDDTRKWMQNRAESSLFIEEDELVGIEDNKNSVMRWLMNVEQDQTIVSVVGMGGSGKTTLVAKIFTNEIVKRHFEYCYAWITVSQTYAIEDLLRRLIEEFHQARKEHVPENLNSMKYKELVGMLVNYLESKRYLVVLDDVWDINLWEEIRRSLPDRKHGSRVMLTTRNELIASHPFGVRSYVHHIQPLKNDEAWELFSKTAFSSYYNICCPPELKSSAGELVRKCNGLPLAIAALGGLMSSKKSAAEWNEVCNSLNWHLSNHASLEPVKIILSLSYNNLPNRLKHCFLYCSLFPEDYQIQRKRLIRLWIAEGFIEQIKGLTLEEVADTYLMELVFRSMLQVVHRNEFGRPRKCKMHDLMREFAQSTSEKEKFHAVYDGKDGGIGARRLSIETNEEIKSSTGMSQLRSFLVFRFSSSNSNSVTLPSGFKVLRVLDLENVPIHKLPDDLKYLFNLRYLNLRGTRIKELPKFIGKLRNLQTLNIVDTEIEVLPADIGKLVKLRHLITDHHGEDLNLFRFVKGTKSPSNISNLKELQVLSCIESQGNIISLVGTMTQLTRVGITNVKERDGMDLCGSIQKLNLLHYLIIVASDEEEILRMDTLSSPPPHLRNLILFGKLQKLPNWFCSLQSVTYICLHWSRLEEDILPHIEALPSLSSLALTNAYVGRELCFSRGFAKVIRLRLRNFPLLNKITIAEGVMRNLESLLVNSCMELKTFPLGIEYLAGLKTLELFSIPMHVVDPIRVGGVDRAKVVHIPEINYYYNTPDGRCYESLS